MWTRLLTLVNPFSVGHIEMWTMGVNHMVCELLMLNHMAMWTRLLTLVQVGDWRKYALEAIIMFLLLYFFIWDKGLLFMLELYWSET